MKEDAPAPHRIPKKRRVLEDPNATLDRWIAEWLARGNLTPSERRRLEVERERRKAAALIPDDDVGVLIGREGVTPEQLRAVREDLAGATALIVSAPIDRRWIARKLSDALRDDTPIVVAPDFDTVVRSSTRVIAAPKETAAPVHKAGVWAGVKYAKHRGVPVRVVLPNGEDA